MEKELKLGQMDLITKDNLLMGVSKGMVFLNELMETHTKENSTITKCMERAFTHEATATNTLGIEKTELCMEKEGCITPKQIKLQKEYGIKEKGEEDKISLVSNSY